MSQSVINRIEKGLEKYYKLHGRNDYFSNDIGKFAEYCDANDFDDEAVVEEMSSGVDNCMLLDFDENVPGVKQNDLEAIYKILRICYEEGKDADFSVHTDMNIKIKYTEKFFEISDKDIQTLGDKYKSQCPNSFLGSIVKDKATFKIMMVGEKNNAPYIQNLTDDYLRCRVEMVLKEDKPLTMGVWASSHPHIRNISNISKSSAELIEAAVKGFASRICPVLLFQPVAKIQASLSETATVMFAAINFVGGLANGENCPFQVDFCIAYDRMQTSIQVGDDDDEEDSDDDNKAADVVVDYTEPLKADIVRKLESNEKNGVVYCKAQDIATQVIQKCYDEFKRKTKQDTLSNKRIIVFVDKRSEPSKISDTDDQKQEHKSGEEKILIYSPPNDCNTIPKDAINEYGLSATSICLIPNIGYTLHKMMMDKAYDSEEQVSKTNIASNDKVSMITLSFHVESVDRIVCYIYFMGEYHRFLPKDIVDILPLLFDNSYGENENFRSDKYIENGIKECQKVLVDAQFNRFRRLECGREFYQNE